MTRRLYRRYNCDDGMEEVEIELHSFLSSALDGGELWTSHPGCFTPGNEPRYALRRRLSLDLTCLPTIEPAHSHYIDWATVYYDITNIRVGFNRCNKEALGSSRSGKFLDQLTDCPLTQKTIAAGLYQYLQSTTKRVYSPDGRSGHA
jgi:hypothetical protein